MLNYQRVYVMSGNLDGQSQGEVLKLYMGGY